MIKGFLASLAVSTILAGPSLSQEFPSGPSTFGAEMAQAQPLDEANACLQKIGVPFSQTVGFTEGNGWRDVSSWAGDLFFFAGGVECSSGRVTIREAMIVQGFSETSNRRSDRAVKVDEIVFSGVWNNRCGPFSGMGADAKNLRWFTWSGESSPVDRYYEVIRSSSTGEEQRIRTASHARVEELIWSPSDSTQCATAGRFAAVGAEARWRGGDVSRMRAGSLSGDIIVHHPKVALNIEGVRPSSGEVNITNFEIMNVSDRVTANSETAKIDFGGSAAGLAPFSLFMSKYARPLIFGVPSGLETLNDLLSADLSNAASLSDAHMSLSIPDLMAEPSVVLPVSMALDFGSVGIGRVTGSLQGSLRMNGSGSAEILSDVRALQVGDMRLRSRIMFRNFEKHILEDVASGSGKMVDANPLLHSFTVSVKDDGIDDAYYSLTGKTLRDVVGQASGAGISGPAFIWMRDFRTEGFSTINALFTTPVRIGEGLLKSLYVAGGSFSTGD